MSVTVCVCWCLSVCWIAVNGQNLGHREGDVCKDAKGEKWIFQQIRLNLKALKGIKTENKPVICGFNGTEPIVCCKSQVNNVLTENKSNDTGDIKDERWIFQQIRNNLIALEGLQPGSKEGMCDCNKTGPAVSCASQVKDVPAADKSKERGGDFCKIAAGASWTCETVKDCPMAVKAIQEGGKWPEICGLNKNLDVKVCCEPEVGRGAKSIEMCKKYAESVFIRQPDELSEGGVSTYDSCGFKPNTTSRAKRALEGAESKSREYPHMALIATTYNTDSDWICIGSLISERFVLTAAQCIANISEYGFPIIVGLGDLNIQSEVDEDESESQPTEYEVVEILPHPDYKHNNLYNDIALLKLDEDVSFTESIRPICLQTEYQIPATHATASVMLNTDNGGSHSVILISNISLHKRDDCNKNYYMEYFQDGVFEPTLICAGDIKDSNEPCSV